MLKHVLTVPGRNATLTCMPKLTRISIYPIKSLEGLDVTEAQIVQDGALQYDRAWSLFKEDGKWFRAKDSGMLHRIRTAFAEDYSSVTLRLQDSDETHGFNLQSDLAALGDWISDVVEQRVHVRHRLGGFPDDRSFTGPTVVSTGTLNEVASWYDSLTPEEIHWRMRANLVVDADEPFYEDRLLDDLEHVVAFRIGSAELHGISATGRCVVPTRDPVTGEQLRDFQKVFMAKREETFPVDIKRTERFKHLFCLTIRTYVPQSEWGKSLRIGDSLEVIGRREIEIDEAR